MSTHIGGIRLERTDQLKLQKAVKDESIFVALGSIILSVIMVIVFFVLHRVFPERVPMDLPVIIGAVGGCAVAIGNFFLMAVTVQKVAGIENYDQAYRSMQVSYRYRTFLQLIWCVLTMVLGFINPVAGMLPLLWPSLLIKGRGILNGVKN
jgi:uncharacterized BrkB/YihY/UPF0761 family membrane protein